MVLSKVIQILLHQPIVYLFNRSLCVETHLGPAYLNGSLSCIHTRALWVILAPQLLTVCSRRGIKFSDTFNFQNVYGNIKYWYKFPLTLLSNFPTSYP